MFASTFVVVSRSPTLYAPAPLTGFQTSVTDVPLSTAPAAGDDSTGVPGAAARLIAGKQRTARTAAIFKTPLRIHRPPRERERQRRGRAKLETATGGQNGVIAPARCVGD